MLFPWASLAITVTLLPSSRFTLGIVTSPEFAFTRILVSVVVQRFPSFVTIDVIASVRPLGIYVISNLVVCDTNGVTSLLPALSTGKALV